MILDTSSILVLKYGRHVPPVTNTGACVHVVQRVPSGVPPSTCSAHETRQTLVNGVAGWGRCLHFFICASKKYPRLFLSFLVKISPPVDLLLLLFFFLLFHNFVLIETRHRSSYAFGS